MPEIDDNLPIYRLTLLFGGGATVEIMGLRESFNDYLDQFENASAGGLEKMRCEGVIRVERAETSIVFPVDQVVVMQVERFS